MYLCYVDESGTPDVPGNTSHYVLAGLSVPIRYWKMCDQDIERIKARYDLTGEEIHVAWLLRSYLEQTKIPGFEALSWSQRRSQAASYRTAELLRLQRKRDPRRYKQARKTFRETARYVHLTLGERRKLATEIGHCVSQWRFARLFAECIDKVHFDPARCAGPPEEQAFEQVVSRFELYLKNVGTPASPAFGLLIHDNNETVAKRHTALMKRYHERGTFWTNVASIIETPLFVDSQLTSMVQVADLCAYALRRYLENNEVWLFSRVFRRADRKDDIAVGVRHFTKLTCTCDICAAHRRPSASTTDATDS